MHGVNPDDLTEQELLEMYLMWNAGLVGNVGIMEVLGMLTTVQINKALPKGHKAYSMNEVAPDFAAMMKRELTPEEQAKKNNEALNKFAGLNPMIVEFLEKKVSGS